jgi:hypothetical protein
MLAQVSQPITFCFQVLFQKQTNQEETTSQAAACLLLIDRISCASYAEFSAEVARPEATFQ